MIHGRTLRGLAAMATGLMIGVLPAAVVAGERVEQNSASTSEIRDLQRELDDVRTEVEALSSRDDRRGDLTAALDEIDDEVAYFRVVLRRDGNVPQREVDALRTRLASVERALDDAPDGDADGAETVQVSVGTEMNVRLQSSLHSDRAEVEDRFYATTVDDLQVANRVAVPAGAEIRGVVDAVDRSSRTDRSASLSLSFDRLTVDGRNYPVRLTLTEAQESGIRDEANRIGVGAGVGGVIGGLLGGVRGALTGILIGAGGTVAATEGEDVELPAGTVLRVRFDSPVEIDIGR